MNIKLLFSIGKFCCYLSFFVCMIMIFITGKVIFGIGALMFALLLIFCYNKNDAFVSGEEQ